MTYALLETYKDEFMIQNHSTIAAIDEGHGIITVVFWKYSFFFQDRGHVCIALPHMILPRRKMTIDQTDRGVVHGESTNYSAL